MAIILEDYTSTFNDAWKLYSDTLRDLRAWSEAIGIRRDELYLPTSAGSKHTANAKWNYLLKEIVISGESISEDILFNAVVLYANDRKKEARDTRKIRMPMMSVFLNPIPRDVEKSVEIIDYIREAFSIASES